MLEQDLAILEHKASTVRFLRGSRGHTGLPVSMACWEWWYGEFQNMYISNMICSLPKEKVMLLATFGLRDDLRASKFRQCNNLGDSRVAGSVIHGVGGFGGRPTCTGFSHKLMVYSRKPRPFFRFLEFRHFAKFRVDASVLVQG